MLGAGGPEIIHGLPMTCTTNASQRGCFKSSPITPPPIPPLSLPRFKCESVRTEPNPQVLGSVLYEGGPDPCSQVRGPEPDQPDLRFGPNRTCHTSSPETGPKLTYSDILLLHERRNNVVLEFPSKQLRLRI